MNNLCFLRKKLKLSYRSLETYVGIDRTTLNNIEHGTQRLNDRKIDVLCDFFKVSSDFLLGKSDIGIIVELKRSFAVISKSDYEMYLEKDMLKEYIELNSVWRIPNNLLENLLDPENNTSTKKELLSEIDMLSEEQLAKVLKFIREILI